MPSLQVRDLPEALYFKLSQAAERDHRSLAQEAVFILEKGLEIEKTPKLRRKELFCEINAYRSVVSVDDLEPPADMIREDRGR